MTEKEKIAKLERENTKMKTALENIARSGYSTPIVEFSRNVLIDLLITNKRMAKQVLESLAKEVAQDETS